MFEPVPYTNCGVNIAPVGTSTSSSHSYKSHQRNNNIIDSSLDEPTFPVTPSSIKNPSLDGKSDGAPPIALKKDKIGNYQVLDLLGKGGFACVYRALACKTGQYVAIKMIDKKLMKSANMAGRVRNEAEIHCQLKHPSIVELYSYFEDKNYVYMVMELCAKGELYTFMRANQKIFNEVEASKIFKQIIEAVVYLHSHGIIHRDLSLANLLLTNNESVKISDFGLATRMKDSKDQHFTMCGTPNFISPEIATRNAHSFETDVWSLGSMLYTLLVGRPPFDTENIKSTLNKVVNVQFEIPSHLSIDAQDLIFSLLKKEPDQRLKLFDILRHPFISNHNSANSSGLKEKDTCSTSQQNLSSDSGNSTMGRGTNESSSNNGVGLRRMLSSEANPSSHLRRSTPVLNDLELPSGRSNFEGSSKADDKMKRMSHRSRSVEAKKAEKELNSVKSRSNSAEKGVNKRQNSDCRNSQNSAKSSNPSSKCSFSIDEFSESGNHGTLSKVMPPAYRSSKYAAPSDTGSSAKEKEKETSLCLLTPPLDSSRLKPIKQATKNATISILEDCSVLLEFSKTNSRKEKVSSALRFSSDGMRITLIDPNLNASASSADAKTFTYHNLPAKHWKRYQYAARFVQVIRSNTPKVTLFNSNGKFVLMDNSPHPDFEAVFRNSTFKVRKSKGTIKITDESGVVHNFSNYEEMVEFGAPETLKTKYTEACKAFAFCERIEKNMKELEDTLTGCNESLFPVTLGKRWPNVLHLGGSNSTSTANSLAPSHTSLACTEMSSFGLDSLSSSNAFLSMTSRTASVVPSNVSLSSQTHSSEKGVHNAQESITAAATPFLNNSASKLAQSSRSAHSNTQSSPLQPTGAMGPNAWGLASSTKQITVPTITTQHSSNISPILSKDNNINSFNGNNNPIYRRSLPADQELRKIRDQPLSNGCIQNGADVDTNDELLHIQKVRFWLLLS